MVEKEDKDKFTDSDGKVEVGKPDELLGVALVADCTRTCEEACKDVEVEKIKDDKNDGSTPG